VIPSLNKMLEAVGQHSVDFPLANCVELHHFIIHCFHSRGPYFDVCSSLHIGKSLLYRRGLMADDKCGYCTLCVDYASVPQAFSTRGTP
jgi:hypothetical protein